MDGRHGKQIAPASGDRLRAARLSGAIAELERVSGLDVNAFPRAILRFEPDQLTSAPDTEVAWKRARSWIGRR